MRADCLPHARVSVTVDGAALTEYSTESGDGMGATTYVEAVPGATFAVELNVEAPFAYRNPNDRICFDLHLDGEWARGAVLQTESLPVKSILDGTLEAKNGLTTRRSFHFAEHATKDLEIEGIVERPPSPAPPVPLEDRDPDDLTLDEAREQLRLLRARETASTVKQEFERENHKRKRERSVTLSEDHVNEDTRSDGDDEVIITAEWDRRKRMRVSAEGEEVVDLTEY